MSDNKPTDDQYEAQRLIRDWEEAIAKSADVAPRGLQKRFLYYYAPQVMKVLGRKIDPRAMLEDPQPFIKELREHAQ